jgi:hypothetical protein
LKHLRRACLVCGRLNRGLTRCPSCEPTHAEKYGGSHRAKREALLKTLKEAQGRTPCVLCGKPLGLDVRNINLHHEKRIVDGGIHGPCSLAHALCDSQDGGIAGSTM